MSVTVRVAAVCAKTCAETKTKNTATPNIFAIHDTLRFMLILNTLL
jgi:hypothetical protein